MGPMIPAIRYADAPAAIRFLCEAFGFIEHLVVPGEDREVAHAQLILGRGMIMVGSTGDDDFSRQCVAPKDVGGVTQSAYVVVKEIDAHYERAKAAGAEIVQEIAGQEHGGRLYGARDPEGHLWSFGSYDPWVD